MSRRGQTGTLSGDTEPLDVQTARHEAPNPTQDSPHGSARIMDISKVTTEETHFDDSVPCALFDAKGEPELDSQGKPVSVSVVSAYSSAARKNAQAQKQALAKLVRRYGAWEAIPQAELDALDDKAVAACLTGWQGFESNGAPFPFSFENAVVVIAGLRTHRPKQLAQIEGAIAAHASFFQTASAR